MSIVARGETFTGTITASEFLGSTQYQITIPSGATSLAVSLTAQNSAVDLGFALRYGQPVEYDAYWDVLYYDILIDDYYAGSVESAGWSDPIPGTWYIGILNYSYDDSNYTLQVDIAGGATATPTPIPTATYTPTPQYSPTPTATPTATSTPTATATPLEAKTWSIGSYSAQAGNAFEVLLRINSAQGIAGGECQINFDPLILTAGQAQTDTLTTGFRIKSHPQSNHIRLAFAHATGAAAGSEAVLVKIPMTVKAGAAVGTSNLTFSTSAALYHESTTPFSLTTVNGSINVLAGGPTATPTPTATQTSALPTATATNAPTPPQSPTPTNTLRPPTATPPPQTPTPTPTVPGTTGSDLNHDGTVDLLDLYQLIAACRGLRAASDGDTNGDHQANYMDALYMAAAWHQGTPAATATPRPTRPPATATPLATATPTATSGVPTPPPTSTPKPGSPEASLCNQLFSVSYEGSIFGTDAVDIMAEAAWGATELSGGTMSNPRLYGTLTQSASNLDDWSYAAAPADRLIVAYAQGPTIEFAFTRFEGWMQGDWEDFTRSHTVDFTAKVAGQVDVRIQSECRPATPDDVAYDTKQVWERRITGTVPYEGEISTLSILHTGKMQHGIDPYQHIALHEYEEQCSGTVLFDTAQLTISEEYWASYTYNSQTINHVFNYWIRNNSSAVLGGTTYQYQNATVRWEKESFRTQSGGYQYNVVQQPSYWICGGSLLKNGQAFGTLQFSGPVVVNTHGPDLLLHLGTGEDYFLHTLIQYP